MAVKKLARMGHPILRRKARPVTPEEFDSPWLHELLADMDDTMKAEGGIGIAAPQIAEGVQVAIIQIPGQTRYETEVTPTERLVIINPALTVLDSNLQGFWEGCLSVPGLRGFVERPRKVQVDFFDEYGKPRQLIAEDFLATVFQHELDHLFGTLYVDRLKDSTLLAFNEEFAQFGPPGEVLD